MNELEKEKTRGQLLDDGGKDLRAGIDWRIKMPNSSIWVEKPSENGSGWFAGDCLDMDNLIYVLETNL